jgi:flagellar FliL protein
MLLVLTHATKLTAASQRKVLRLLLAALLLTTGYGTAVGCKQEDAEAQETKSSASTILHLEPFVVNLADSNGQTFLRVGIDLGVEGYESRTKNIRHQESVAVMRDSIINLLSTCKSDDLLTPDGKKKLKQELSQTLNERLPDVKVREIYFNEFMVQR